ncbi:RNA ligase [Natronospira bacteriovora]|uniref:RNA ligase n=1 Tax=Natronospira bacteriovora TaxID=3069753 RepID=A0ABU0W8J2_9GAMM|nr:RNA ligase [Natronospira sp. AB-CW4]MDQ2069775.1 RNA ligase [Natronospira sp. AB-CW4]
MTLLDQNHLDTALERGKAERLAFGGMAYARLTDEIRGVPKGSVVLPDGVVVPGYPSIARIQALDPGLGKQFDGPFWAEEKMDGFNIRIFAHEGEVHALSRGGFVCPFATDRMQDLLDPAIFEAHPNLILCAELVGPDNPYLEGHSPQVQEDVDLFIFDMMEQNREGFLSQEARMRYLREFNLPHAEIFGRFGPDDINKLGELILKLDEEGKEGLVLKPEDQSQRAKYVTGRSNTYDFSVTGEGLLDLPPEYFTNRLMRMGLFMAEHGQQQDHERLSELGHALMQGLFRAIEISKDHNRVGSPFRCRFNQRENAYRFIQHIEDTGGQRVKVYDKMPRQEGDYWVLEFERVHQRMTGFLNQALQGGRQFD